MHNYLLTVCLVILPLTANSALLERLGGLAYYDTEADLTWLGDANYANTSGYATNGLMSWADANAWAATLSVTGVTGWRLPETRDYLNDGATYTYDYKGVDFGQNISWHSEMSNMYYNVLGNIASRDASGISTGCGSTPPYTCLANSGPFNNIQSNFYWSSTEYVLDNRITWGFNMASGVQGGISKRTNIAGRPSTDAKYYAWAVQSGDISAVPVPTAVWLFGSGLIGLIGFARRKA